MRTVKYFKAKVSTKKFKKGQVVWVTLEEANHLHIISRWKGNGRYVSGTIAKWSASYQKFSRIIGDEGLKEMEVTDEFYNRVIRY